MIKVGDKVYRASYDLNGKEGLSVLRNKSYIVSKVEKVYSDAYGWSMQYTCGNLILSTMTCVKA